MTPHAKPSTRPGPRVGVVLLDIEPRRAPGEDPMAAYRGAPPGFLCSPEAWEGPADFVVAPGCAPELLLHGDAAATSRLVESIARLEQTCDLVTTDCGFFWQAWPAVRDAHRKPLVLSALDFLPLLRTMTRGRVGVLTYSENDARRLLKQDEQYDRLAIVGFSDLPAWAGMSAPEFANPRDWTVEALRDQFVERCREQLSAGGLRDTDALLLECTIMPQFRADLRRLTEKPILDGPSIIRALLR